MPSRSLAPLCLRPFRQTPHIQLRTPFRAAITSHSRLLSANMPHAVAKVNGKTVAETDKYEVVEGNIYFPPTSIDKSVFTKTETHTFCPWKGTASYYSINVDGTELKDAAWFYPEPKEKAIHIKDHVAFYKDKVAISSE